jgi:light-regulated signal transduction histidine kinase (bacteriophytochrome)
MGYLAIMLACVIVLLLMIRVQEGKERKKEVIPFNGYIKEIHEELVGLNCELRNMNNNQKVMSKIVSHSLKAIQQRVGRLEQKTTTKKEKDILDSTKEFAKTHKIPYDERTESMILNAMREQVKQQK